MPILSYAIFRLRDQIHINTGVAYSTLDEAMIAIEFHFRNNAFGKNNASDQYIRESPITLATYGPAADGWKSRVVEVRNPDSQMVVFAVYKILEVAFNDPPAEETVEAATRLGGGEAA